MVGKKVLFTPPPPPPQAPVEWPGKNKILFSLPKNCNENEVSCLLLPAWSILHYKYWSLVSKKLSTAEKLRWNHWNTEKSLFNDTFGGIVENERFLPYVTIRQAWRNGPVVSYGTNRAFKKRKYRKIRISTMSVFYDLTRNGPLESNSSEIILNYLSLEGREQWFILCPRPSCITNPIVGAYECDTCTNRN